MKKISSTIDLQPGSTVRIYKKGYGYTIADIVDNNAYFWAVLTVSDIGEFLQTGDPVEAYIWHENSASIEMTLNVLGVIKAPENIILFGHNDTLSRVPERKCLTANVSLPVRFFTFSPHETSRKGISEPIEYYRGTILLLSDREATIKSAQALAESHFIRGHVHIGEDEIEIIGKIDDLNPDSFIYNVQFTGMAEKSQTRILDYIFSVYRE